MRGAGDDSRECGASGAGDETWHGQLRQQATWTLKYSVRGHKKPLYAPTRTSDWRKALKFKKNKFREVMGGAEPWEEPTSTTLAEVLELVIAHYTKNKKRSVVRQQLAKRHVLAFPAYLKGAIAAAAVTSTMVTDDYVVHRQGQGAANGTINRELALIRQGYRIALKRADARGRLLVSRAPAIELLDEAKPRDVTIQEGEFQAIVAALLNPPPADPPVLPAPDVADLVQFYRLTGWRNREVRQLEWTDVNWFAETVRLRSVITKSGEPFELPFADDPDLKELLKRRRRLADELELATGRRVKWIFFRRGRCGRVGKRSSLSSGAMISNFSKDWDAALRAVGLPDHGPLKKRPHDFRRVVAEETLDAEVDLQTAANTVGWNSIASLLRYRRRNKKAVARAVKERARLRRETAAEAAQLAIRFAKRGGRED